MPALPLGAAGAAVPAAFVAAGAPAAIGRALDAPAVFGLLVPLTPAAPACEGAMVPPTPTPDDTDPATIELVGLLAVAPPAPAVITATVEVASSSPQAATETIDSSAIDFVIEVACVRHARSRDFQVCFMRAFSNMRVSPTVDAT